MKRSAYVLALLLSAAGLAGCSSLNVSWSFTASYNTGLMQQTGVVHKPAAPASAP